MGAVPVSIAVLVAETDPVLRAMLERAVTAAEPADLSLTGSVSTLAELLAACRSEQGTNRVAVLGSGLGHADEVEQALPKLLATGARALVVASRRAGVNQAPLLLAGASGLIYVEDSGLNAIAAAIRSVAAGTAALHPEVANTVLQQWRAMRQQQPVADQPPPPSLSERELTVLQAMSEGLTTRAAASRLGIAEKTVESHKSRIYAKLGARNQANAISIAVSQGLLKLD